MTTLDQKVHDATAAMTEMYGAQAGLDWSALLQTILTALISALGGCILMSPKRAAQIMRDPGPIQKIRMRRIVGQTAGAKGHEDKLEAVVLDVGYYVTEDEAKKLLAGK